MAEIPQKMELLKRFQAFEYLNDKQLTVLAAQVQVEQLAPGETLFESGDTDEFDYFLLSGSVELTSRDDRSFTLLPDTEDARRPLSSLRPRLYSAKAKKTTRLLRIHHEQLNYIMETHRQHESDDLMFEHSLTRVTPEMICQEIKQAINEGQLTLPSLPDVAVRIRNYAHDESHSMDDLVKVIMLDPAITAKLIQCANSPLFRGVSPIQSCSEAVVRLGKETTQRLVTIFCLQELFKSDDKALAEKLKTIWRESVDVAAICAVLATKSQLPFQPEVAMMAGLLHRIGELSILVYSSRYKQFLKDSESIDMLIRDYRAQVACEIVLQWRLGDVYFQCMKYLEHWYKDQVMEPDYSDLLNIAILHEYIHTHQYQNLPHLDKLPSFSRLSVGTLTPEFSIKVLEESHKELNDAKALLKS